MTKFESGVKVVPASQEAVYEKLSDLSNLEKVKDRLPEDKVKNLSFDAESMTIEVAPVGKITRRIIEVFQTVQNDLIARTNIVRQPVQHQSVGSQYVPITLR